MTPPKVSILIPCYNAAQWVGQAIESALAQTWPNKEVIVVDDGSTDGSLDVIRSYGDRIHRETGSNRGGNIARNRLLELAAGEWLQYLDADDYLLPEKIERQFGELADPAATDVAYSPVLMEHWADGAPLRREVVHQPESNDPWILLIRWQLPQTGAPLWRRQAVVDVGGWKPDQPCCQENELYLRLLESGKRFVFCPTPGAVYRQWSNETVCRRDPLKTFLMRMSLVGFAEKYLSEVEEMDDKRRLAIAATRLQCARSIYHVDRAAAKVLVGEATRLQPYFKLPSEPWFPLPYRVAYSLFGFANAERFASMTRRVRSALL